MANFMPFVHQARRTLANHLAGNPFADQAALARTLADLERAYLRCGNAAVAHLLHVELDRFGDVVHEEG